MAHNFNFTITAPDLPRGLTWINSKPLSPEDFRGRVVLLDFWTYCCINCMHIIPDLKYLEDKYADEPVVVVGVHSAKFDNEENAENIRQAVLRYGVKHPVVVDKGMAIWNSFGVHAWPTLVLITPDGKIAGSLSGEGHRETLDQAIAALLNHYEKEGKLASGPPPIVPEEFISDTGLLFPGKVTVAPDSGNVFIADSGNHRIVIADKSGNVMDIIGNGLEDFKDGAFAESSFRRPQGMALDGRYLYIADTENHAIRRADLVSKTVETIAGTGEQMMWGGQGGPGNKTAISSPWDVLLKGNDLFIAMAGSHQIWVYNLDTCRIDPYAGSGREARIDGFRLNAAFAQPSGLTLIGDKLYVADSEISCIREVNLSTGNVLTIAGGDLFDFGDADGRGDKARFQHPLGIAALGGALYVADSYNHKIRKLDPNTKETAAFSGTGKYGDSIGSIADSEFYEPGGICSAVGKLYVADTNNHKVKVIDPKSGSVSYFEISGLPSTAASPRGEAREAYWTGSGDFESFWKNARPVPAQPAGVSSNLLISLDLPAGWHLNDQLPVTVIVETARAAGIGEQKIAEFPVEGITLPIRIPLEISGDVSGELLVSVSGMFCDDGETICVPFEDKLRIPLKSGAGDLSVTAVLEEPI
ncbi:MAG: redoxin domain-containing protein [bacterium]